MWKCILMGPRPPSAWWPMKEKPSSPAPTPSKPENTKKVHQKVIPKSKVESIQAAISALGPDPDPTVLSSLREALQKATDMSGKPENPRQRAPTRGSRKRKRGSHDWREPSSCWAWTVQTQSQSKSLWKRQRDQCRVLPVGGRLDSCLKFVERAKRTRSETTDRGTSSAGVVCPVRVAGCPGVGRSGTRKSPTARPEEGGWEQHRRVGCFASRSGSIEEGTGCVVGEIEPITIDGHVNNRDPRVSFQSDGSSHR